MSIFAYKGRKEKENHYDHWKKKQNKRILNPVIEREHTKDKSKYPEKTYPSIHQKSVAQNFSTDESSDKAKKKDNFMWTMPILVN